MRFKVQGLGQTALAPWKVRSYCAVIERAPSESVSATLLIWVSTGFLIRVLEGLQWWFKFVVPGRGSFAVSPDACCGRPDCRTSACRA